MRQHHDVRHILRSEILAHESLAISFELLHLIFVGGDKKVFGQLDVQRRPEFSSVDEMKKMAHHQRLHIINLHHVRLLRSEVSDYSRASLKRTH